MLHSRFDIELGIDGVYHKISVKQLSNTDKKRLKEFRKKGEEKFSNIDDLNATKALKVKEYEINEQILKEGSFKDKVALLWEQKELNKEISILNKAIKLEDKTTETMAFELESYYKEMFELSISGEGKAALVKDIEDKGFTYKEIFETMLVLVAKAVEKK